MNRIENIIFDLGGVLLDIDFERTLRAFEEIGFTDIADQFNLHQSAGLFADFERGKIQNEDFLDALARKTATPVKHEALLRAWNSILTGFRKESVFHLRHLAERYRLYLLSNTNHLHYIAFSEYFIRDTGLVKLEDCFTKAWFSHELGLRKPNAEIYTTVLADGRLAPEATLFIDDLASNIAAAAKLGIQTHQLLPMERIENLGL